MRKGLNIMEKKTIEARAAKVMKAINYEDGKHDYVDSVRLARFFGFEVEESDQLPATEDGCITVSEDAKKKCIIVNDTRSFESKRFIIVHELSHYLLHYMGSETFFRHRENKKGKNMEENDADYLAACLLMPRESFKKYYYDLKQNGKNSSEIITELQRRFRTPRESVERRISEVV